MPYHHLVGNNVSGLGPFGVGWWNAIPGACTVIVTINEKQSSDSKEEKELTHKPSPQA